MQLSGAADQNSSSSTSFPAASEMGLNGARNNAPFLAQSGMHFGGQTVPKPDAAGFAFERQASNGPRLAQAGSGFAFVRQSAASPACVASNDTMSAQMPGWRRQIDKMRGTSGRVMNLGFFKLGDEGPWQYLFDMLETNVQLTELCLCCAQIGDEETRYLSKGLKVNATVKKLLLNDNRIGDEGMRYLSEGLKLNLTLEEMDLEFNQVGDEGMRYLSDVLKVHQRSKLDRLLLDCNQVGDEAMRYLSEALIDNQTVETLHLRGNHVGDEGARFLSKGLKMNHTLKTLCITYNQIGDEGMRHLIKAIRVNTSLGDLGTVDFQGNLFSEDANRAFWAEFADIPARQAARKEYLSLQASRSIKSASKRD